MDTLVDVVQAWTDWVFYAENESIVYLNTDLTIIGERYNVFTGRRQHIIEEATILDWRNADWININEINSGDGQWN